MCLQGQNQTVEDEDADESDYRRSEGGSIKSEPLIDTNDRELSVESTNDKSRPSSSFNDLEAFSQYSSGVSPSKNVLEKPKDLKLDTCSDRRNRSLIRSAGGRRSFDKPQMGARSFTKRSNTVDEVDDSKMGSRSSKTLPATPTSGTSSDFGQDSNTSHPFYRRFYSHCMILPLRKKKKETAKKFAEDKNPDIVIDTSPQKSQNLWQQADGSGENVDSQSKEDELPKISIKIEEYEDSPKMLPVIDDLLAEIMENVTLMELDMKEEEKRLSIHSFMESNASGDRSYEVNTDYSEEIDVTVEIDSTITSHKEVNKGSNGTTVEISDSIDDLSDSDVLVSTDGSTLIRSNSRVGSLISKFEKKTC